MPISLDQINSMFKFPRQSSDFQLDDYSFESVINQLNGAKAKEQTETKTYNSVLDIIVKGKSSYENSDS